VQTKNLQNLLKEQSIPNYPKITIIINMVGQIACVLTPKELKHTTIKRYFHTSFILHIFIALCNCSFA